MPTCRRGHSRPAIRGSSSPSRSNVPKNFSEEEILRLLESQGYTRIHARSAKTAGSRAGPTAHSPAERARVIEALEAALRVGNGHIAVYPLAESEDVAPRPSPLVPCSAMEIFHGTALPRLRYPLPEPSQSTFSFNSPVGACDTCRGFGRVIGVDYGLVIPDESKTLGGGAVKPWQTQSFKECQDDLGNTPRSAASRWISHGGNLSESAEELGNRRRTGLGELEEILARRLVRGQALLRLAGDQGLQDAYPRALVALSRVHALRGCEGSRLKPDALLWRVGNKQDADAVLAAHLQYRPKKVAWNEEQLHSVPGLTIHDLMLCR